MEFWNDQALDESWNALITLARKYQFILIGGWACYLYTGTIKSQDIDIIVDFEVLNQIKRDFLVKKNVILKMYEFIFNNVSVEVYVPYYSEFVLSFDCISENIVEKEGMMVPRPEVILILKQQAELERKESVKGQKDRVDIVNMLIKGIDMQRYVLLVKEYHLKEYMERLETIVRVSKPEFAYLGITNPRKIKLIKKRLMEDIASAKSVVFH